MQYQLDSAEQQLTSAQTKLRYESSAREAAEQREEEARSNIEDLSRRLATQEATFTSESAAQNKRIAHLQRVSEDAAAREQELEINWSECVQENERRESLLQAEIEQGEARITEIEAEKQELQEAMDRLASAVGIETDLANRHLDDIAGDGDASVSGSVAGSLANRSHLTAPNQSISVLSPSASVARKVRDSGKSLSDMYVEYIRNQEELRRERLEVTRLNQALEGVFQELREKEPVLEAQRKETEELRADCEASQTALATLSVASEQASRDRDQLRLDRDRLKAELDTASQQLEDMGRQVRALTKEIILRDDPSAEGRMEDDGTPLPASSKSSDVGDDDGTQAIITKELVTFSSLTGLLAQNQRLLRVTRDLAYRVENRETRLHNTEEEAMAQAAEDAERLSSQLDDLKTRLEVITSERDLFRDLIQSRESRQGFTDPSNFENSVVTTQAHSEETLATLRSHFDEFKAEAKRDYAALRQELSAAQAHASDKAIQAAQEQTLREGLQARLRSLEATSTQQRQHLDELNASNASLHGSATERDAALRRKESELLELRVSLETTVRESAHLRSEVSALRSSESRLVQENQSLVGERTSLSEMLKSLSGTQREMEASAAAYRTRLESQVARLERELNNSIERAAKAEEESRLTTLRARVDSREAQIRAERTNADLASLQKNLAVSATTIENLRSRENELQEMLSSARSTIVQLEHSTRSAQQGTVQFDSAASNTGFPPASGSDAALQDAQLADLRASLANAEAQTDSAHAQVQQYQAIAQTSEETLQGLQQTYDEYRSGTESVLADKQARIEQLTDENSSARAQLADAQASAEKAVQELAAAKAHFDQEKRELEDAVAQLNDAESRAAGEHAKVQADVEAQLEEARAAHSKFETELLLHGEDLQALNETKTALAAAELSARQLQLKVDELQVALEAERKVTTSQRNAVEQERADFTKRIDDLTEQNVVLHNSLQSLTSHAPAFDAPDAPDVASETTTAAAAPEISPVMNDFASVIKYLRREKEVADLQLDLAKQEATRLRVSLEAERATSNELRAQLVEEQSKVASTSSEPGKASMQAELLARTNEASIVRESNMALREESDRLGRKVHQLESELAAAQSELEPLQEQARLATVELENAQASLKLAQEDNDRWQARAQSILRQYNQVDPDELAHALQRATKAESDLATATQALEEQKAVVAAEQARVQQEKAEALSSKDAELAEKDRKFDVLRHQTIDRIRGMNQTIGQLRTENESLKAANQKSSAESSHSAEQAQLQLDSAKRDLEAIKVEVMQLTKDKDAAISNLTEAQAKIASLEEEVKTASAPTGDAAADADKQKKWDEERGSLNTTIEELKNKETNLLTQLQEAAARAEGVASASEEVAKLKEEHARAIAELNEQRDAAIEQGVSDKLATLGAKGSEDEEGSLAQGEHQTLVGTLQARITDLETQLKSSQEAVHEKESSATEAQAAQTQALQDQARLKAMEGELAGARQSLQQATQKHMTTVQAVISKSNEKAEAIKARDMEIEALKKELADLQAKNANASGANAEKIEAEVQARLTEREKNQPNNEDAPKSQEEQLKAEEKARLDGRQEAELKHRLMVSKKDKEIENLKKALAEMTSKQTAEPAEAAQAAAADTSSTEPQSAASGKVAGGTRGGTPVGLRGRGARAAAASARGASAAAGKRKASEEGTNGDGSKKARGGGAIQVNRPSLSAAIRRSGPRKNDGKS